MRTNSLDEEQALIAKRMTRVRALKAIADALKQLKTPASAPHEFAPLPGGAWSRRERLA